jgi:protocatechuate 3,4-dioxygenase beta subunit
MKTLCTLAFCFHFLGVAVAFADDPDEITGQVLDAQGNPVKGVKVSKRNQLGKYAARSGPHMKLYADIVSKM